MHHPDSPIASRLSVASGDAGLRWLIAFLLTGIYCALQISQSLMMGSLALPPVADGVVYYVDGAVRLQRLYEQGFGIALSDFFGRPPHSPLSSALALIGFSIFGIHPWVGPVMNALVLFFFVRLFLEVAKSLPIGQTTLLAVAFLGVPLAGHTIMDFRPDMICGLLIAVGTLWIILRDGWISSWKDQVVAGLFFAAALWAKPTIFPFTLALFAVAMVLASWNKLKMGELRTPLLPVLVTTGTAISLASPCYISKLREVVNYIWATALGPESSVWVQKMPLQRHILFYLTGLYGGQSLGPWLYMGLLLGGAVFFAAWYLDDRALLRRAFLVSSLSLIAYVTVTVPEFKGPHGFLFAAIFLSSIALACIALAGRLPRAWGWALCIMLVVFSMWQFRWDYQLAYPGRLITPDFAESRWQIVRQVLDTIGNDVAGKRLLQTTSQAYLTPSVLEFEYLAGGRTPPISEYARVTNDPDLQRQQIARSDFVVALTPDFPDVMSHLPSSSPQFRKRLIALTEESGLFEPPTRIPDPVRGGAILVYKRLSDSPSVAN